MGRTFFITGTGTEVGKTVVTSGLARAFLKMKYNTKICKPVASGGIPSPDAVLLKNLSGVDQPVDEITPVTFDQPLAPYSIVRDFGGSLDLGVVIKSIRALEENSDILLVEGIGGVVVPLLREYSVIDLISELQYPVLVVADAGLGTINHTVMTLQTLRHRRVPVVGFVANHVRETGDLSEDTNPDIITELSGVDCLGRIPYAGAHGTIMEQLETVFEKLARNLIQ